MAWILALLKTPVEEEREVPLSHGRLLPTFQKNILLMFRSANHEETLNY